MFAMIRDADVELYLLFRCMKGLKKGEVSSRSIQRQRCKREPDDFPELEVMEVGMRFEK